MKIGDLLIEDFGMRIAESILKFGVWSLEFGVLRFGIFNLFLPPIRKRRNAWHIALMLFVFLTELGDELALLKDRTDPKVDRKTNE